jgi:hypothetical protein
MWRDPKKRLRRTQVKSKAHHRASRQAACSKEIAVAGRCFRILVDGGMDAPMRCPKKQQT